MKVRPASCDGESLGELTALGGHAAELPELQGLQVSNSYPGRRIHPNSRLLQVLCVIWVFPGKEVQSFLQRHKGGPGYKRTSAFDSPDQALGLLRGWPSPF